MATYGGYAAMVAAFWLKANADLPGWPAVLPVLAGVVMFAGLSTIVSGSGGRRDLANETDAALDERERQVRDHAYRFAYVGVASAFMLLITYAAIVHDSGRGWLPRTWNESQAIVWGVLLLTWTLPSAVVAWTEPDPIADEPTEVSW